MSKSLNPVFIVDICFSLLFNLALATSISIPFSVLLNAFSHALSLLYSCLCSPKYCASYTLRSAQISLSLLNWSVNFSSSSKMSRFLVSVLLHFCGLLVPFLAPPSYLMFELLIHLRNNNLQV